MLPKGNYPTLLAHTGKCNSFEEADVSDSNEEGKFEVQRNATTHTVDLEPLQESLQRLVGLALFPGRAEVEKTAWDVLFAPV